MKYLNKITADAYQKSFLTGNAGQRIAMTLRFMPSQNMWMMDLQSGDFVCNGIHVVSSVNLLRNYKNVIPFGISCITLDSLDPYYIDDFAKQRCSLFLLTAAEVEIIEGEYFE